MDWLTQMNEALDYIESHLTDEIDLDEIGRITACPAGLFQRISLKSSVFRFQSIFGVEN